MIALGSDHGGYELKQEIKKYLDEKGLAYWITAATALRRWTIRLCQKR